MPLHVSSDSSAAMTQKRMEQVGLFDRLTAPTDERSADRSQSTAPMDAGVPLVRVTTCRPQMQERGSGWLCLLECGHEAHVPVGPRPRHVPHVCPPEQK